MKSLCGGTPRVRLRPLFHDESSLPSQRLPLAALSILLAALSILPAVFPLCGGTAARACALSSRGAGMATAETCC